MNDQFHKHNRQYEQLADLCPKRESKEEFQSYQYTHPTQSQI